MDLQLLFAKNKYPKFISVCLSEIMSYRAVDGFGIISGIVGYKNLNIPTYFIYGLKFFYILAFIFVLFIY